MYPKQKRQIKIHRLFILTLIIFLLTGCLISHKTIYHDDISTEDVTRIEIYDCRSEVNSYDPATKGFHEYKDPVCTLTDDDIASFLEDFGKIKFESKVYLIPAAQDPSFNFGKWVVRILFTDGASSFYSSYGYNVTLDADGNSVSGDHSLCDDTEWEALIAKYYSWE